MDRERRRIAIRFFSERDPKKIWIANSNTMFKEKEPNI
jgi:hypothetical protein